MSADNSFGENIAPQGTLTEQIVNGKRTHPVIQDTKNDFKGIANSGLNNGVDGDEVEEPLSHFHSLFYDLFTWKFPKATGFVFFSIVSLTFAFRYINVLRYIFKGAYLIFAAVAALEIAGKPLGAKGLVSNFRPKRYYTIPRSNLERIFAQLHELINFFVLEFQRVLFVENIFATVAAFFATFTGYFLIKYLPLWGLLLLATVTSFTAPLIYINNQELIDAQISKASGFLNEQLNTGKQLSEKYAGEAAARAKATASDLTAKVQEYTGRKGSESSPASPLKTRIAEPDFPTAPTDEPIKHEDEAEPLLA